MSIIGTYSHFLYKEVYHRDEQCIPQCFVSGRDSLLCRKSCFGNIIRIEKQKKIRRRNLRVEAMWPDLSRRPSSIEMEAIHDSEQLDQILVHAQQNSEPIIIDWMAAWCRKCIYLKPKLEKLAAEFDTKAKFYYVDVNKVPQTLVKRGKISKMPTIQLWKDGEMKEEVIGGHKGWLVIEEVREMIQKYI